MKIQMLTLAAALLVSACVMQSPGPLDVRNDSICGARDLMLTLLEERYGETADGHGREDTSGNLIELMTSGSGTWTLIATTPLGVTCIRAVGTDWQSNTFVAGKNNG